MVPSVAIVNPGGNPVAVAFVAPLFIVMDSPTISAGPGGGVTPEDGGGALAAFTVIVGVMVLTLPAASVAVIVAV